ncbi:MAG TPA: GNAT family N-acetyltransferase [Chitinophagaceae bacterium]|nr:GNAT family N-acetyltransferase [Chitinophagaceae bacterium]
MNIKILNTISEEHLTHVRNLINEFVKWHLQRHLDDKELINEYFDSRTFEKELASLPGKYAMPKGRLLLAFYNNQPAGCVALRQLDDRSCEMKRMFVYSEFHGKGIGRALATAIIAEAKKIGYTNMKLDTSIRQVEAQKLYQSFGFKNIKPYYDLPEKMKNWLVFMELKL